MLTCINAKPQYKQKACVFMSLCVHDVVAALHTPVAYLCLGLRSKSPVNQTEVIRNCLHRRKAIVCPDGELIPPKVFPAQRRTACLEIPSQIKSQFSLRYLIPPTHLISCSHLRSCLRAAIRSKGRGTLRSCSWQINSWGEKICLSANVVARNSIMSLIVWKRTMEMCHSQLTCPCTWWMCWMEQKPKSIGEKNDCVACCLQCLEYWKIFYHFKLPDHDKMTPFRPTIRLEFISNTSKHCSCLKNS